MHDTQDDCHALQVSESCGKQPPLKVVVNKKRPFRPLLVLWKFRLINIQIRIFIIFHVLPQIGEIAFHVK